MNSTRETIIKIDGLTKDYQIGFLKKKKVRALDNLTLEVQRGEIFGFLGPNGAGKTTTLKILMRLIFPTSGTVRILGKPIDNADARNRIGYLPENPYFYDYLSGRELLLYSAALFGIPKDVAERRATNLLQIVGLEEDRANRQLRKYSKGMLQRVGIAQALINDPEIVFMDEPMSGLDPIGRREVRDLLLSLREQNKTIFFSSHILSDVETMCDRAAILSKGKLIRCGSVAELTGNHDTSIEVVASGIEAKSLQSFSVSIPSLASATHTPNGAHFVLDDESQIVEVIKRIHDAGGKLISVTPRRVSLEEIFSNVQVPNKV